MTHAEQIIRAVAILVKQEGQETFTRDEVRRKIGVSREIWDSDYTAIFQGMRKDHPGGAPNVGARFEGVFHQIEHGKHGLTEKGIALIVDFDT